MKKAIFTFLLASLLISSCSSVTNRVNEFQEKVEQFQAPKIEDQELIDLEGRILKIADEAKGRVGVSAVVLETGESVSLDPDGEFPMQSVYKFPIAMAVLKQVDEGKLKLDQKVRVEKTEFVRVGQHSPLRDKNPNGADVTVRELIRLSVAESDGTTSLNIGEMIVANPEKEIGQDWQTQYRNWASPEGATSLLRALHEQRGISKENRELLLKFMIESGPGAKRLKGLLPAGTIVAHKTGTSGTNKDGVTAATNDIGIITLPSGKHLAIAVFVSDSPADDATREGVIAKIAKEARDMWSK